MTTTRQYDFLNRLTSISTLDSDLRTLDSHVYSYNSANQRTRANLADNSFWLYQYDSLGQVISGKKYWSDWTPVAGQQFEYAFDDIGNRTSTEAFGYDSDGNLTNDGRWMLTWDAENRLIKMESQSSAPTASKRKLEFAYDHQGRRIEKIVSTNDGSAYVAQSTSRFVYDEWNLV